MNVKCKNVKINRGRVFDFPERARGRLKIRHGSVGLHRTIPGFRKWYHKWSLQKTYRFENTPFPVLNAFKNGDEKIPSAFSVVSLWTIVKNASKSMRFSYKNGFVWTGENKTKTLVWSKIFCFVFVSTGTLLESFPSFWPWGKLKQKRKKKFFLPFQFARMRKGLKVRDRLHVTQASFHSTV